MSAGVHQVRVSDDGFAADLQYLKVGKGSTAPSSPLPPVFLRPISVARRILSRGMVGAPGPPVAEVMTIAKRTLTPVGVWMNSAVTFLWHHRARGNRVR